MKSLAYAVVAVASFAASSAPAALAVGTVAPDFSTRGAQGGRVFEVRLASLLRKGPVVLYFFPAAFTPGCTIEARQFAEASDQFRRAGATVLGVAADPIETLQRFSVEECRSRFPVAVATSAMITAYDVRLPSGVRSNRTSYVIDGAGRVAYAYSSADPARHVGNTLSAVRALRR